VLLVTARRGTVDDAAVDQAGRALTTQLGREPGVIQALSYWTLDRPPPLRSADGRRGLVLGRLAGDADAVTKTAERLEPRFTRETPVVSVLPGGSAEVFAQTTKQAEKDLHVAEGLTAPLTFAALVVLFGGAVAALLPLGVALVALLGSFLLLTLVADLTQVSVFSLNLTTAMSLGLAIDYSLFIVSRYREELVAGNEIPLAISHALLTAGRTVIFSAGTIVVSLAALMVFPISYLRSFTYAGIVVVALACLGAVVVLPAVLAALGPRVGRGRTRGAQDMAVPNHAAGFWYRQAHRVMHRPILYGVVVIALLLTLGAPFLHVRVGRVDDRVLSGSHSSRTVSQAIRDGFNGREASALSVVAAPGTGPVPPAVIDRYAASLSAVRSVSRVDALTGYYINGNRVLPPNALSARFRPPNPAAGTWFSVVPSVEPLSPAGEALVHRLRADHAPFRTLIGGDSARLVDTKRVIGARLPYALLLIALATFVLLFFMVGSLVVPVKAILLNILSLSATFGAMVWIFQYGHLSSLLDFTPTGTVDVFTPILMFCVAFGLSMDYEVFLLSRIKEEYDLTGDNEEAVAIGLQRTGRIVTGAALLLAIVFASFTTSQVQIVKLFGVGLTLAVLVDAFLIRATLVPAFMRLAGRANWWAPRALRRFHLRWGIWESEPIAIIDRYGTVSPASTRRPD
jgi:RND superfamily putative drug exporter